jgi:hypothetical protein
VAKAAQAGIDEIWNTYNTGVIPNASDFVALKMVSGITIFSWNAWTKYVMLIWF